MTILYILVSFIVLVSICFVVKAIARNNLSDNYYKVLIAVIIFCVGFHYQLFFEGKLLFTEIERNIALDMSSLFFFIVYSFVPIYYIIRYANKKSDS